MRKFLTIFSLFFSVFFATAFPSKLLAVNFTVDDQDDAVSGAPDGICDAPGADTCTLREAILEANAAAGPDTITVPAGNYALSLGSLVVSQPLTLTGAGKDVTILRGNSSFPIFQIPGAGSDLTLSRVTLREGSSLVGGGIANSSAASTLTLSDCAFRNNIAGGGGAIASLGNVTITNCDFTQNQAPGLGIGGPGGALLIAGTADLTVTGSFFESNTSGEGGAIVVLNGTLILTHVQILDNEASNGPGGGVANLSTTKTTTISDNSDISGNEARDDLATGTDPTGLGGGVYVEGPLVISKSTIENNRAERGSGGVHSNASLEMTDVSVVRGNHHYGTAPSGGVGGLLSKGPTTITDSSIEGNRTEYAVGGLLIVAPTDPVVIEDSHLTGNEETLFSGSGIGGGFIVSDELSIDGFIVDGNISDNEVGGLFIQSLGTASVKNMSVTNNVATGSAGGVLLIVSAPNIITIEDSTFSGNQTLDAATGLGGGLEVLGNTVIKNSTISGNSSASAGGGLFFASGATTLSLVNTTITNNSAPATKGGNISIDLGNIEFLNTIVSADSGGGNCAITGGTLTSNGHNIEDEDTCNFGDATDHHDTDPKLGPLANNGGLTQTHNLASDSPAIDAGTDAGAPTTDQRGVLRPLDGNADGTAAFDIGAVEFDRCGDGVVENDLGEECDDGNSLNTDACTNICKNAVCGDSFVEAGVEQCDDNNTVGNDGCSSTCTTENLCGNGVIDGSEACDDGNTESDDGCTSTCTVEDGFTCVGAPSVCTAPTSGCSLIR